MPTRGRPFESLFNPFIVTIPLDPYVYTPP
jgi:hypothetical protein